MASSLTIGTAPDSWGVWFPSDPQQLPAEQFLREVAEAGWSHLARYRLHPLTERVREVAAVALDRVDGPPPAVVKIDVEGYEVAADPENAPEWQTEIKVSKVLERNDAGEQVLVHNEVDGRVKTLKSTLRFDYDPPTGLTWSQVKGDMNGVEGRWEFKDLGDGTTEATCTMEVDLGRVLGMAIRGPVADVLRKQLVETMPEKLKRYVEQ